MNNNNNNNNKIIITEKPCIIPLVLSTTGIVPKKLHETLKLLNLL
jgi:hypothetical protein